MTTWTSAAHLRAMTQPMGWGRGGEGGERRREREREGVAVLVVKGRRYVVLEALVGIAQARARGAARRFPGSLYRLTLCSVDMVPHTGRLQPCLNPSHVRA